MRAIARICCLALSIPAHAAVAQTTQSGLSIDAPAASGTHPRGFEPLAVKDCLQPHRARAWVYVGDDALLIDAGKRKYRITLAVGCTALAVAQRIDFESGHGTGRMCGMPQDYIRTEAGRCKVRSIELMPAGQYEQAQGVRGSVSYRFEHAKRPNNDIWRARYEMQRYGNTAQTAGGSGAQP